MCSKCYGFYGFAMSAMDELFTCDSCGRNYIESEEERMGVLGGDEISLCPHCKEKPFLIVPCDQCGRDATVRTVEYMNHVKNGIPTYCSNCEC